MFPPICVKRFKASSSSIQSFDFGLNDFSQLHPVLAVKTGVCLKVIVFRHDSIETFSLKFQYLQFFVFHDKSLIIGDPDGYGQKIPR